MVLVGSFLFMNLVLGGKTLCGEAIESSGFGTLLKEAGPCWGRRGLAGGGRGGGGGLEEYSIAPPPAQILSASWVPVMGSHIPYIF